MGTYKLFHLNENSSFATVSSDYLPNPPRRMELSAVVNAVYGGDYGAELVENIGNGRFKVQPGYPLDRGGTTLSRPIIIERYKDLVQEEVHRLAEE